MKTLITIETLVAAPIEKIWNYWTAPEHIQHWNFASDDWCSPAATNDLKPGGKFNYRMEAKDGSMGFDFEGTYTAVKLNEAIEYILGDERNVYIKFEKAGDEYKVAETFEAEDVNSVELQKGGWQSILNNFKNYVEKTS